MQLSRNLHIPWAFAARPAFVLYYKDSLDTCSVVCTLALVKIWWTSKLIIVDRTLWKTLKRHEQPPFWS